MHVRTSIWPSFPHPIHRVNANCTSATRKVFGSGEILILQHFVGAAKCKKSHCLSTHARVSKIQAPIRRLPFQLWLRSWLRKTAKTDSSRKPECQERRAKFKNQRIVCTYYSPIHGFCTIWSKRIHNQTECVKCILSTSHCRTRAAVSKIIV